MMNVWGVGAEALLQLLGLDAVACGTQAGFDGVCVWTDTDNAGHQQ